MSNSRRSLMDVNIKCSCKGNNLDKLLQPNILSLLVNKNLHGYVLIQELEAKNVFKGEKIDKAGIYRTLKNLEAQGLVSSEWNIEDVGAAKKVYKITASGKECLKTWIQTLEDYKKTIEAIIEDAKEVLNQNSSL
ncbi:PadR family transcriptional regulator [Clostridium formicaceticum]|uniref:Lineage-specific thermal regulator protein n=1 Tax=Clostridium formicaceticum TaxID=1497 RepID=A0AAC9WH28_9CLOT|nr:PadR family transcriptional regulator [Clostridium formicaceticum]AOY77800.1 transcriptional regulator [Clostridium formicaceticum]ARE88409.1 lineage-specific thermal regulator protein [Clostridium formicaceticum]